jgi:hypothetical protein
MTSRLDRFISKAPGPNNLLVGPSADGQRSLSLASAARAILQVYELDRLLTSTVADRQPCRLL